MRIGNVLFPAFVEDFYWIMRKIKTHSVLDFPDMYHNSFSNFKVVPKILKINKFITLFKLLRFIKSLF